MINGVGMDTSWQVYSGSVNKVNSVPSVESYDYKRAQMDTEALLKGFSNNTSSLSSLKKDTADFLTDYTNSMNGMYQSASVLTGGGVDKLLYDKNGDVTEDSIKKTVDAVQNMVSEYNESLALLNKNSERGSGVLNQIERMSGNPVSAKQLDMLGISVNKDATLKLDEEALTKALTEAADKAKETGAPAGQFNLLKNLIGGHNGLAEAIKRDAQSGLSENSASLVGNDIAAIKEKQQSGMQSLMGFDMQYGSFNQAGAYFLSNQAAVGIMMNMLV